MRSILADLLLANETEYASLLNEASAIFKSIHATFLTGHGSVFSTPDTTQEQLTSSGTTQVDLGPLGSSLPSDSGSRDGESGEATAPLPAGDAGIARSADGRASGGRGDSPRR